MATLDDHIENYLKRLLSEMGQDTLHIRRTDLAERFQCVPSQINYVLKTRFTAKHGYIVESRRGGGGYIRITRLQPVEGEQLISWAYNQVGRTVSKEGIEYLLARLEDAKVLEAEQIRLIRAVIDQETRLLEPSIAGMVRAALFRALLVVSVGSR